MLLLYDSQSADSAGNVDSASGRILFRHIKSAHIESLMSCRQCELGKSCRSSRLHFVHYITRIEACHLPCQLYLMLRRVEAFDKVYAADAVCCVPPHFSSVVSYRGNSSESRYNHSSLHISFTSSNLYHSPALRQSGFSLSLPCRGSLIVEIISVMPRQHDC